MRFPNGVTEQYRKQAEYLASVNLSESPQWEYPLKTLPRPTGRARIGSPRRYLCKSSAKSFAVA